MPGFDWIKDKLKALPFIDKTHLALFVGFVVLAVLIAVFA